MLIYFDIYDVGFFLAVFQQTVHKSKLMKRTIIIHIIHNAASDQSDEILLQQCQPMNVAAYSHKHSMLKCSHSLRLKNLVGERNGGERQTHLMTMI